MAVDRLSIATEAAFGAEIRASAQHNGVSISAWLAEAAADRLRNEQFGRTLAELAAEYGAPTPEQQAKAEVLFDRLGVPRPEGLAASA